MNRKAIAIITVAIMAIESTGIYIRGGGTAPC